MNFGSGRKDDERKKHAGEKWKQKRDEGDLGLKWISGYENNDGDGDVTVWILLFRKGSGRKDDERKKHAGEKWKQKRDERKNMI
jgi:hypothetical protein